MDLVDRVADLVEPFLLREDRTYGILPYDIGVHASVEKCRVNFVDNLDFSWFQCCLLRSLCCRKKHPRAEGTDEENCGTQSGGIVFYMFLCVECLSTWLVFMRAQHGHDVWTWSLVHRRISTIVVLWRIMSTPMLYGRTIGLIYGVAWLLSVTYVKRSPCSPDGARNSQHSASTRTYCLLLQSKYWSWNVHL